jgi:AraC-like DNA-binding protein
MCASEAASPERCVSLHRHQSLPGVELISQRGAPGLSLYSTDFALLVPDDWEGTVLYRSRRHRLHPGLVLCVEPGEVVTSSDTRHEGQLRVLSLASELLRASLSARHATLPDTKPVVLSVRPDSALFAALRRIFEALETRVPAHELGETVQATVEALVDALIRSGEIPGTRGKQQKGMPIVERLRETLLRGIKTDQPPPDLATLSKEVGLSRFQTLRWFRRHYGVTPRAFHLHFRLALARCSLRAGAPLAEVAASCGFVDQSHFTRQFKRLMGVTPGQYARAG